MRIPTLLFCALISVVPAIPALALECANSGAAPTLAPNDTGDGDATACGSFAAASGEFSMAMGYSAGSPGNYSTALGFNSTSAGLNSAALGYLADSAGTASTALGRSASSSGGLSVALGYEASASALRSSALGYSASSDGSNSTALGHFASATGSSSSALGAEASSIGDASTALGKEATSTGPLSLALGYRTNSTGEYSTALGAYAFAELPNTLVLGSIPSVNFGTAYANVGMGTTAPSQAVDVERSGAAARFQLTSFTAVAEEAPQYIQRRARGTRTAPAAVQNGDNLGLFSFRGYNGATMGGSRATITAQAAGNFTGVSNPTRLIFSTTPVGQTTPQQVLVITPDGKVQVNGQNLTVPDYVFEDDYELMPLDELRSFIDQNGHLPGIPSADEVQSGGLDLAGSQLGLLQKVEELTLYTLQQEGRLADQESLLETQQEQLLAQQERIDRLEALLERIPASSD